MVAGQRVTVLLDVLEAAAAIDGHLSRGPLSDGSFDAVRVRLIEIGAAVQDVSSSLLDRQPEIPWRQVRRNPRPARALLLRWLARDHRADGDGLPGAAGGPPFAPCWTGFDRTT